MARVMSPNAPANEKAGMRGAYRYYSMFHLTAAQIIESAELICASPLGQRQGYEWCNGFRTAATEIAAKRNDANSGIVKIVVEGE